jgi:hypothetical protein
MLTGAGNEEVAVRALNFGVYDYLHKEKLSREQLIDSINTAFQKHNAELIKQQGQDKINRAFDKAQFYKLLEQSADAVAEGKGLALLLIEVNNLERLTSEYGLIVRDNLLRHIARQTYEKLKDSSNPYITRLGDESAGVLIDYPGSRDSLENEIRQLCTHFDTNPYLFLNKPVPFTVSIGAVIIDLEGNTVTSLIDRANRIRNIARQTPGNSCHISALTEIQETENRHREEEEQKRNAEEAERERLRIEEEQQRKDEEERLRREEEKRKENERLRLEEEKRKAVEAARLKAEEEKQRLEVQRREAEAERLRLEEEKDRENERLRLEEEKRKAIEAARLKAEEEEKQKAIEAERQRLAELEKQLKAEEQRRKEVEVQLQEEAEKRKLLEETEQKRKQQEEELRRKTEEAAEREKLRQQEELKRKQEEQLRHEEASRKKAEEDRRQKEEQLRKEAEARLKADEEKQRIAEQERLRQEEEKRKASEVERQRQEEIKRKAAEAAEQERQRQEEEKRKAAEAAEQEKQQQEEEAARQKAEQATSDEITIDESTLDENSLILKKAFNENRVIQTFQPVIAMFTPETGDAPAMFKVDIEMVDERGNIKASIDIDRQHTALTLQQFTDRWILREIIGRIANSDEFRIGKIYLITISEAWLADITLFTWLKKLLTGIENIKPGSSIALELPVNMLVAHKKRALALIKALKQSHGFEIAIGEVNTVEELRSLSGLKDFDLLTVKWKMIDELRKNTEANSDMAIISALKSQGVHIIFDGIEDATMMTEAISLGSDYVMGNFIGGPQSSLAGAGNVETFDISY